MDKTLDKATHEIKEIITKYDLSNTEVEILFIELIKENIYYDFVHKMSNAYEKAMRSKITNKLCY